MNKYEFRFNPADIVTGPYSGTVFMILKNISDVHGQPAHRVMCLAIGTRKSTSVGQIEIVYADSLNLFQQVA